MYKLTWCKVGDSTKFRPTFVQRDIIFFIRMNANKSGWIFIIFLEMETMKYAGTLTYYLYAYVFICMAAFTDNLPLYNPTNKNPKYNTTLQVKAPQCNVSAVISQWPSDLNHVTYHQRQHRGHRQGNKHPVPMLDAQPINVMYIINVYLRLSTHIQRI